MNRLLDFIFKLYFRRNWYDISFSSVFCLDYLTVLDLLFSALNSCFLFKFNDLCYRFHDFGIDCLFLLRLPVFRLVLLFFCLILLFSVWISCFQHRFTVFCTELLFFGYIYYVLMRFPVFCLDFLFSDEISCFLLRFPVICLALLFSACISYCLLFSLFSAKM